MDKKVDISVMEFRLMVYDALRDEGIMDMNKMGIEICHRMFHPEIIMLDGLVKRKNLPSLLYSVRLQSLDLNEENIEKARRIARLMKGAIDDLPL